MNGSQKGLRLAAAVVVAAASLLLGATTGVAAPPVAASKAVSPTARDFTAYNFRFRTLAPGFEWQELGPNAGDTLAQAFCKAHDEIAVFKAFTVGVERARDADAMAADIISILYARGTVLNDIVKKSVMLDAVEGIRITGQAVKNDGNALHFVGFVGSKGGREYEFGYLTSRPLPEVAAAADAAFAGFELIDPRATIKRDDLADPPAFVSPLYKYGMNLPAGWSKPVPNPGNLEADFTSRFSEHSTVAMMPSLLADGVDPTMAAAVIFKARDWDVKKPTPEANGDGRFTTFRYERSSTVGGRALLEVAKLWVGQGVAIFGYATSTAADSHALTAEALAAVDVTKIVGASDQDLRGRLLPLAKVFSPTRPLRDPNSPRGKLQNELGCALAAVGKAKQAAGLFEISNQYQLDPQVTANWLDALSSAGEIDRAREVAVLAASRFPTDKLVIPSVAHFYRMVEDYGALTTLARSALDAGIVDDDIFHGCAVALLDANQLDEAARLLATYKKRSNGVLVVDIEARTLIAQRKPDEAIAILDQAIASVPGKHPLLRQSLAQALIEDKQLDRAEREINRLVGEGAALRDVAIYRGELLLYRGQTNEAVAIFENAKLLGLDPREADSWIHAAKMSSGQGKNGTIRDAIEAVTVPVSFFTDNPKTPLEQSAGAAYRRSSIAMRIQKGEPQRTTTDDLIEIYDANGVEAFTTIKLKLDPRAEKLFINCVEVRDEKGALLSKGKPDDFYVLDSSADTTEEGSSKPATREQTVNIPVAGLRPGCTLRVTSTRQDLDVNDHIHFQEELASHSFPVGENVIFISGDGTKRLTSVEFNGAKRIDRFDGIAWHFSNPPSIASEPHLADLNDFVPGIAIGPTGSTWRDEGLNYLKVIADRLKPDEAVTREVKALALDGKPPLEKLRAVVQFVQSRCAYKAIAFGPRAYIPTPPGKVIEQRYGDCKDQALLVHLMLKEAGIESHLALARMEGVVYPKIASRDQFDHMIVNVPDCGGAWWIDTTNRDMEAIRPTPGPGLLGRSALVLDEKSPTLVALPEWDPKTSGVRTQRSLDIDKDGAMNVVDRSTARGLIGDYFRGALRGSDPSRRNEYAARLIGIDISSVRSWSVKIGGLDTTSAPLTIDATYAPRQKLKKTGTRFVGEAPAPGEQRYIVNEVVETRRLPFKLTSMVNYEVALDLTYPSTWTPESLPEPKPIELSSPFGAAQLSFAQLAAVDGKSHWSGKLAVRDAPGVYPASQYADFCQSRQAILDAWSVPLIFRTAP